MGASLENWPHLLDLAPKGVAQRGPLQTFPLLGRAPVRKFQQKLDSRFTCAVNRMMIRSQAAGQNSTEKGGLFGPPLHSNQACLA
jgi:hypothetical protein